MPAFTPDTGKSNAGRAKLDVLGVTLVSVSTPCVLNGLVAFQHSHSQTEGWTAVAVGCLLSFIAWQKHLLRKGQQPLMDWRLYASRPFVIGCVVAFIHGTAMFGSTYLLPVFIQMGLGLPASYAGNLLLPVGLVLAVTIPLVDRLADTQPTHWLVSIGMALLALSFGLMLMGTT